MKRTSVHIISIVLILFTGGVLLSLACQDVFLNEQSGGTTIWIEQASAPHQCIPLTFHSEEEAVQQLKANNIRVFSSDTRSAFAVCRACSCPTGTVYLALIYEEQLGQAEQLGWVRSESQSTSEE